MAAKNKTELEELLQQADTSAHAEQQTSSQTAAQSAYSTAGITSRSDAEKALANAQYQQSQAVTDAAAALSEWQNSRPAAYQSAYQSRINSLLNELTDRGSFSYNYLQDPLYSQYAQAYTQNAHNASADAAAEAAALTGGYGSSYAVSAAQQAYQQQINQLNNAIPTLYSLALDTYNSAGDDLVTKLENLSAQEQSAQSLYDKELADYYTQLEQKGEAYNTAYQQDYTQYTDYLSRLNTLYSNYSAQEQAAITQRQQTFNNVMTVLGVIGDAVQLAISGTTGLGSLAGSLLNTGYNIYSGNRQYEAQRADTAWSQQMQELERQDSLNQQQYENEAAEREYQNELAQQQFSNNVTSQKLAIAKGEWALKQSKAAQQAQTASSNAAAKATSGSSAVSTGSGSTGTSGSTSSGSTTVVPYTAARMRSLGRSDTEIRSTLLADGYSSAQVKKIMEQLNG